MNKTTIEHYLNRRKKTNIKKNIYRQTEDNQQKKQNEREREKKRRERE